MSQLAQRVSITHSL